MLGHLFSRLFGWIRDTETPEESGDERAADGSASEFMPSRLDASVNEAHGMDTRQAQKEVTELQEQAAELDDQHPEE